MNIFDITLSKRITYRIRVVVENNETAEDAKARAILKLEVFDQYKECEVENSGLVVLSSEEIKN